MSRRGVSAGQALSLLQKVNLPLVSVDSWDVPREASFFLSELFLVHGGIPQRAPLCSWGKTREA